MVNLEKIYSHTGTNKYFDCSFLLSLIKGILHSRTGICCLLIPERMLLDNCIQKELYAQESRSRFPRNGCDA